MSGRRDDNLNALHLVVSTQCYQPVGTWALCNMFTRRHVFPLCGMFHRSHAWATTLCTTCNTGSRGCWARVDQRTCKHSIYYPARKRNGYVMRLLQVMRVTPRDDNSNALTLSVGCLLTQYRWHGRTTIISAGSH